VLQCVAVHVVHEDGSISVVQLANDQCVAVCCSVLQCVAICCSVLQCMLYMKMVASLLYNMADDQCVAVCCSVLQCVAVCCSVTHCRSTRGGYDQEAP